MTTKHVRKQLHKKLRRVAKWSAKNRKLAVGIVFVLLGLVGLGLYYGTSMSRPAPPVGDTEQASFILSVKNQMYQGKNQEALTALQTRKTQSMSKAQLYEVDVLIGDSYVVLNDQTQALNAYKEAYDLQPNESYEVAAKLGGLSWVAGHKTAAIVYYEKAIELVKKSDNPSRVYLQAQYTSHINDIKAGKKVSSSPAD